MLRTGRGLDDEVLIKTGIMLGLGETSDDIDEFMDDALEAGVQILTLGQYLQPAQDKYLPVVRYVPPEEFAILGEAAKGLGFKKVASGPFVRSSYHARDMAESF